jgi:hypothetical protein
MQKEGQDHIKNVTNWLAGQLIRDAMSLAALPDDAERLQYLHNYGMRFRLYFSLGNDFYVQAKNAVDTFLKGVFAGTMVSPAVLKEWKANYRVERSTGTGLHNTEVGTGQLQNDLTDLPRAQGPIIPSNFGETLADHPDADVNIHERADSNSPVMATLGGPPPAIAPNTLKIVGQSTDGKFWAVALPGIWGFPAYVCKSLVTQKTPP